MDNFYKNKSKVTNKLDSIKNFIFKGKYLPDELEIVFNQDEKLIIILDKKINQKIYTQRFSTLSAAKKIAEYIGLNVVKQIKTQVNFFNVDGSKRGYKYSSSNKIHQDKE